LSTNPRTPPPLLLLLLGAGAEKEKILRHIESCGTCMKY
jgi:hypothetical protein